MFKEYIGHVIFSFYANASAIWNKPKTMKINSCLLVFATFSPSLNQLWAAQRRLQFPELPAAPAWERQAARPLRNVVSKVVYIYRDSTSEEHGVTINSDCGPAHHLQPERRRRKGKTHLRPASGTNGLSESVRTETAAWWRSSYRLLLLLFRN